MADRAHTWGAPLELSLLGEQVVTGPAGPVRLRSARTVELLAYLVVHTGAPQTRQRIASLFWPDSGDEQALTNLRRELHHLRTTLGDAGSLVVTGRDLCWQDGAGWVVDLRVFETEYTAARAATKADAGQAVLRHAAAAVQAYGGDLLPGHYDEWVLQARSELQHRYVEMADLLGEARARAGDLTGAVDAIRRRIVARPLDEVGYRRLMELQGELGDRAGAVSTYHHCASVLEQELAVEPDPSTRACLDRLLSRTTTSTTPVPAPSPDGGRSGPAAYAFVGRIAELDQLRLAWGAAGAGHPGLVVVRGDAGVGKTRLVAELSETVRRQGAIVATAQCFGASGQLALAPVADWLKAPAVAAGLTTLEPVWRDEVDRLLPTASSRGERPGRVEAWQRHRFFEGLARALLGAGRPTLLILDNLQWCDQETMAFLAFFLGLSTDGVVLVAATVRSDEPADEPVVRQWVARARAAGRVTELDLDPFDPADTAVLAHSITGRAISSDEARLLQATTGGYPLYIVEAARGGTDPRGGTETPGDIGALLAMRLQQVSESARDIVRLAAAVGRPFSLDLLTEASELNADLVVQAVDELWQHRIVRETGDQYDFSHDLLREAAYGQISPPQRWLLHRRIAQGLEVVYAEDPDAISVQLAEQYHRGGRAERAVGFYRRAAALAAGTFSYGEALRLYRTALSLVAELAQGRTRQSQELAILEAMAAPLNAVYGYSAPELRVTLERTIVLADTLGRRDSMLTGLVGLWYALFVHGDLNLAHRTGERAIALTEPGSPLAGPARFAAAATALTRGHPAEALEQFALAQSLGGDYVLTVGTRPDVHGMAFAAHAHWLLGDDDEALAASAGAIALARSTDNPYCLVVALAYGALTHQMRRDEAGLAEVSAELCDLCDRYDFAYYREWALVLTGWLRGDLDRARRGVDRLKAGGSFARMPYWLSLVAEVEGRDGRRAAAIATLDAAIVVGEAHEDRWWLPEVMRLRAAYDPEQAAVVRLENAARLATAHGSVALIRRCRTDLATHGGGLDQKRSSAAVPGWNATGTPAS